jgi:hypothetical protein
MRRKSRFARKNINNRFAQRWIDVAAFSYGGHLVWTTLPRHDHFRLISFEVSVYRPDAGRGTRTNSP